VYLANRKSNMIISGGVNIYPREIEQVLEQHPAVADIGVFGVPDDEWGESVKAAIELRGGFAAGSALDRLRGRVAARRQREALHPASQRSLLEAPKPQDLTPRRSAPPPAAR
jgi:acyl-CoA synthetase (AMP-forming)/AMP-acid ligase II